MKNRFILSPSYLGAALPALEALAEPEWFINSPVLPAGGKQLRMCAVHQGLAEFVAQAISAHERPVSMAGDCCAAIGVLAGLQRAGIDPVLIWFDAHGDFNTWETSPSGFLGGMPLAMMVGKGEQTMIDAAGIRPLPEARVILSDARDLDPAEGELIAGSKVIHLNRPDMLLDYPIPEALLFVHFDTDVIDPAESPAHQYLAKGGPSSAVMRSVFSRLAQSGRIVAVSLAAWNPALDKDRKSETVSMSLLRTLIGHI